MVYPPKAFDMLIITGVATAINAHNHHAPILAQIRAMQAAAAAHLQGRLTPKKERRAVYTRDGYCYMAAAYCMRRLNYKYKYNYT